MVEQDPHRTAGLRYGDPIGCLEPTGALDHLDTALFGHGRETAGELGDHLLLAGAHLVEVDLRLAEGDAHRVQRLDLFEDGSGMQQGFGGDTTDVQADAAECVVALDQDDLLAEVGGAEGGGVAAGTGAEDHDLRDDLL